MMRRNEQISPEAVSVLKFPLKMSKAGEILEKIMMKESGLGTGGE